MSDDPFAAGLAAFIRERLHNGDDGKTFLVGYDTDMPRFAVAVGLRGEADHPAFLSFARYLLQKRFVCGDYALLLPASLDGEAFYLVERRIAGEIDVWALGLDGNRIERVVECSPFGDLNRPGETSPGLMRREFDRLYEQLKVEPPA